MPITAAETREDYSARGVTLDENGHWSGKRVWSILLEMASATEEDKERIEDIVNDLVPVERYDGHPAKPEATARTIEILPDGSQERWMVTVSYSSAPMQARGEGTGSTAESPAVPTANTVADGSTSAQNRPPTISVSWRENQEILERDINGDLVCNAAGDPFEPPVMVTRRSAVYNFTFWRLPWQLNWATRSLFMDQINSAAFTILGRVYPAKWLKIEDVTFETVWDTYEFGGAKIQTLFFQIKVSIAEKRGGWQPEVANVGRREKIPGPTLPGGGAGPAEMRVICDATGQPVQDPVPLAANGRQLFPPGAVNYLNFVAYPQVDISGVFA